MYRVFYTETKAVHSHMPSFTSSQIQNGAVIYTRASARENYPSKHKI